MPTFAWEPMWGVHPETAETCLDLVESDTVTVNSSIALAWEARMAEMLGDPRLAEVEHRWCDASANLVLADPSPEVHAFVRTIDLPTASLSIDPGFAVTGMPAYLVVEGQESFEVASSIAGFGPLEVTLQPVAVTVDWGDGSITTATDGRMGAPWGGREADQISHTYLDPDAGTVVEATVSWIARWRVGGFTGTVGDLQVTASLDLPVETRQAVRAAP